MLKIIEIFNYALWIVHYALWKVYAYAVDLSAEGWIVFVEVEVDVGELRVRGL